MQTETPLTEDYIVNDEAIKNKSLYNRYEPSIIKSQFQLKGNNDFNYGKLHLTD